MGRELYCDLCRVSVPIEENLQKIEIGGAKIAEVCLTDASKLIGAVKAQTADAAKIMTEATPAAKAEVPPSTIPPIKAEDLPATAKPSGLASREGPVEPAK